MRLRRALAGAAALATLLSSPGRCETEPLAGIVLEDDAGRAWSLDELAGGPVLLVVADRASAAEANAWGARVAEARDALAPWRTKGKVAWLAVADLRGVPDYARDAARGRVREREAGRSAGERSQASPLLLDWTGLVARRFGARRGDALLVLLSSDRRVLVEARGAPTDDALARLRDAIAGALAR